MSIRIPNVLVDAVKQQQAVLFAGAGISVEVLGIAAKDIRDAIGHEIQRDYQDYDFRWRSMEDVCDEYSALNDRITLVNRLAALIPQNATPLHSHKAAVKAFRFIITTNWDLLFEAGYRQIGQGYQVISSEVDAPNFNYNQHNLLKIHGSADKPHTLIATLEDFENYPDTHPRLLDRIGDLLWNNTVLFVGYGFHDEHVRRLLAHIRRQRGEFDRRAYAVMGERFQDNVRTRLLDKRNIEVLPYDAEYFLPELAARAGIS